MPTNGEEIDGAENNKQRTEIKDLPREEKELSEDEQKKVRGGLTKVGAGTLTLNSANNKDDGR